MELFLKLLGIILIIIGVFFTSTGIIGMIKSNSFRVQILLSSTIDTAGFLSFVIGVALYSCNIVFMLKILILILICIVINPVTTHEIARLTPNSDISSKLQKGVENK